MKFGKRRLSRVLLLLPVVFLVISFVPGCTSVNETLEDTLVTEPPEDSFAPLSDEQKTELDEAWVAAGGGHLLWAEHYTRYLGTVNGCTVVLTAGAIPLTCATFQQTVADYTFSWGAPFEIRVLKDGSLCTLTKAYETGLLTKEHIALLKENFEGTISFFGNP